VRIERVTVKHEMYGREHTVDIDITVRIERVTVKHEMYGTEHTV